MRELIAGATLTIGSGITVRGKTGYIGYNPNIGGPTNPVVVNQGAIQADIATGTITINAAGGSENSGHMSSLNGGVLSLAGSGWRSSGTLDAGAGSSVSVNASFNNAGNTMAWSGSGTFTSNVTITGGTLVITSGTPVRLSGTLDGVRSTVIFSSPVTVESRSQMA